MDGYEHVTHSLEAIYTLRLLKSWIPTNQNWLNDPFPEHSQAQRIAITEAINQAAHFSDSFDDLASQLCESEDILGPAHGEAGGVIAELVTEAVRFRKPITIAPSERTSGKPLVMRERDRTTGELEWSDELVAWLFRFRETHQPGRLAERLGRELKSWIVDYIPGPKRQPLIDNAERQVGLTFGHHGVRFVPTRQGDGDSPESPAEEPAAAVGPEKNDGVEDVDPAEIVSPNDERDAWLYEKDCEGVAASEIEQAFKPLAKEKKWALVSGWGSIRAATTRYAKRKGLPLPPRRQQKQRSAR